MSKKNFNCIKSLRFLGLPVRAAVCKEKQPYYFGTTWTLILVLTELSFSLLAGVNRNPTYIQKLIKLVSVVDVLIAPLISISLSFGNYPSYVQVPKPCPHNPVLEGKLTLPSASRLGLMGLGITSLPCCWNLSQYESWL